MWSPNNLARAAQRGRRNLLRSSESAATRAWHRVQQLAASALNRSRRIRNAATGLLAHAAIACEDAAQYLHNVFRAAAGAACELGGKFGRGRRPGLKEARLILYRHWQRGSPPSLGEMGELAAERFLRRRGYRIVGRRIRDELGELDLVAVINRTVVYVEVKTRRSDDWERPAEAVHRTKRFRICRAAAAYAKRKRIDSYPCRFDIVEVVWPLNQRPRINHIVAAFESELD